MIIIYEKITAIMMSIIIAMLSFFGVTWAPEQKQIKNVIYLIGDGMGFNHLEKTKSERYTLLIMDSFKIRGSCATASFSDAVTDSAAGGTALAAGVRTGNGMIGVYYEDEKAEVSYPKNLTELCRENGKMTGVITTDTTTGATIAAFSAHTSSRKNYDEITEDQLESGIDLIWGAADNTVTKSAVEAKGYEYVTTYDGMLSLEEGSKSFVQFTNALWKTEQSDKDTANLERMAVKAVDILDDTKEGFFLMIEGAHIDKFAHSNYSEEMTEALVEFDKTVEAMLKYAEEDGETLVVVTADHETGGIALKDGSYVFTKEDHTSSDVPLLVYGSRELITLGERVNNYEIPIRIARILGYDENQFPIGVKNNK